MQRIHQSGYTELGTIYCDNMPSDESDHTNVDVGVSSIGRMVNSDSAIVSERALYGQKIYFDFYKPFMSQSKALSCNNELL